MRPYKCDICGKGFMRASARNRHRNRHFRMHFLPNAIVIDFLQWPSSRTKHFNISEELPYSCDKCEERFGIPHSLELHKRRHLRALKLTLDKNISELTFQRNMMLFRKSISVMVAKKIFHATMNTVFINKNTAVVSSSMQWQYHTKKWNFRWR